MGMLRTPPGAGALAVTVASLVLIAPAAAPSRAHAARLVAFDSCTELVRYARRHAQRTDGATGVPTRAPALAPLVVTTPPVGRVGADQVAATPIAGADFSQTNVQEAGVDEPDVAKTDGRRLLAVTDGTLHSFDVGAGAPVLRGSLRLEGGAHELLVRGDRVLVIGEDAGPVGPPLPRPQGQAASLIADVPRTVRLTEIDVSDPAAMTVRRTMTVPGAVVAARQTGGTARVVVGSSPAAVPEPRIGRAGLRTWVPSTTLRSRVSGRTFRRSVAGCDDVRRPKAFSGLDLLTVLTVDLDQGLFSVDRDAIMAGADTVYASATSLYVAGRRYAPAVEAGRSIPDGLRTQVHRFDASRPDRTRYRSSGEVEGFVLNQYAMSEHDGVLRVASTSEPAWFADAPRAQTESFVTTLGDRDGVLRALGRVDGLGRGERIYAVRFIADRGYVVTFRQVDPLYTLDLSRADRPRVVGELKIAGYSAYLHPVSDGLLLGVGQDASEQGRTLGTQLSLFDVSDASAPRRLAQARLGAGSSSDAEFDPHAFLYWRPTGLAVVPVRRVDAGRELAGAVGYRVAPGALTEAGRVEHPSRDGVAPPVARSLVVGNRLLTLSYAGLQASDLQTLAPVAFAAIP